MLLGYVYWNPSRALFDFNIPFLGRPILWYGFLFALGFFIAYWILVYLLRHYFLYHCEKNEPGRRAREVAEKLTLYAIIGTLVGARLGDLLFYQDWVSMVQDPLSVIRIWEGGLASHGGAVGILCGLIYAARSLKRTYPYFSWVRILDFVAIPTAFAAACIRVGNFINQEILGKPTDLPWAVMFGHPADGGAVVPRHPVQLYEAGAYLLIFLAMFFLWRSDHRMSREGKMGGLFLILVFSARFFLEFFKVEQSVYLDAASLLSMGQILSIPFILLGGWLLFHRKDQGFNSVGIKRS